MNSKINRMHFKQTLFFIVLMFAFLPAFGFHADWSGNLSGISLLYFSPRRQVDTVIVKGKGIIED